MIQIVALCQRFAREPARSVLMTRYISICENDSNAGSIFDRYESGRCCSAARRQKTPTQLGNRIESAGFISRKSQSKKE
jgi:hypothetical protein